MLTGGRDGGWVQATMPSPPRAIPSNSDPAMAQILSDARPRSVPNIPPRQGRTPEDNELATKLGLIKSLRRTVARHQRVNVWGLRGFDFRRPPHQGAPGPITPSLLKISEQMDPDGRMMVPGNPN